MLYVVVEPRFGQISLLQHMYTQRHIDKIIKMLHVTDEKMF